MDYYGQIANLREIRWGYEKDLYSAEFEANGWETQILKVQESKELLLESCVIDEHDEVAAALDDLISKYRDARHYIMQSVIPTIKQKILTIDDKIADLEAKAAAEEAATNGS